MRKNNKKKVLKKKDGEKKTSLSILHARCASCSQRETRRTEWNLWMKFNAGVILTDEEVRRLTEASCEIYPMKWVDTDKNCQGQEIDRILLYRIPAEGIPGEAIAGGEILARVFPSMAQKMQDEDCGFDWRTRASSSKFSLNQILPTLFTLRDDESRIIAVMSSNVDDLLCGYLQKGAEAMNCNNSWSVKKNTVPSGFADKSSDKMKTLAFTSQPKTTLSEYNQSLMTRNKV